MTIWGPPVDDYSARIWSGLIRDYYLPRLNAWFDSIETGQPFDYPAWERDWVENSAGLSPVSEPSDRMKEALDLIALARQTVIL